MPQADNCELVQGTLGAATIRSDDGVASLACVGESVTSFRTLLKQVNISPYDTVIVPPANVFITVAPFATDVYTAVGAIDVAPNVVGDLYSVLSSCYCFSRGGVRIKFIETLSATQNNAYVSYIAPVLPNGVAPLSLVQYSATPPSGNVNYADRTSSAQVFHNTKNNLASELQVPQYHKWHSRICSEHMVGPGGTSPVYSSASPSLATRVYVLHHSPDGPIQSIICRSAADDTNFGLFISVPPMISSPGFGVE